MDRHPLDPIALVTGLIAMVCGLVALLHQLGAFHLGFGAVALIGCGLLGAGGIALVALQPGRTPD